MRLIHYKPDVSIFCSQPLTVHRSDVAGIAALDSHVAVFETDADAPGGGTSLAWSAKNSAGGYEAYAKLVVTIVDATPGSLKSKLAFWLVTPTGGLLELVVLNSDGGINTALQKYGVGDPNTVGVVAGVGAIYQRTDGGAGTTLYVKESSPTPGTGWVAK